MTIETHRRRNPAKKIPTFVLNVASSPATASLTATIIGATIAQSHHSAITSDSISMSGDYGQRFTSASPLVHYVITVQAAAIVTVSSMIDARSR